MPIEEKNARSLPLSTHRIQLYIASQSIANRKSSRLKRKMQDITDMTGGRVQPLELRIPKREESLMETMF